MKIPINIEYKEIPIEIKDREIVIDVPENKEIIVNVPKTLDEKIIEKIPKISDGKEGKRGLKGEKGEKGEKGDKGEDGKSLKFDDLTPYEKQVLTGSPGSPGEGVARGGTTGQVLAKKSARNFDTEWVDIESLDEDTLQSVIARGATYEAYSKNLLSYPYSIVETSPTVTTITYTTGATPIVKTITEVSDTITTIVLSGIPAGIPTTKTINNGVVTYT